MPVTLDSADSRAVMRVLTMTAAACSILPVIFIVKLIAGHEVLYPDFFGLWSGGRFVLTHDPATIYDVGTLTAFRARLGMPADAGIYPFPYPPSMLLLLGPVGALPYMAARLLWLVVSIAIYGASVTAWRWPKPLVLLLLVAPSSVVCCLVGQNGMLLAGLLLGGLRLLGSRPVLAGAMLGVVALKPQLAVLIPFQLIFGQHWRALGSATIMSIVLLAGTALVFGTELWGAWMTFLLHDGVSMTAGRGGRLMDMMPTVTSGIRLMGGTVVQAYLAQATAALLAVWALWHVRGRDDAAAQACLPLGTFLVTPYAFHYDLPLVTGSVLLVISSRIDAGRYFRTGELPLLVACVALPAILAAHFATGPVLLSLVFGLTLTRMVGADSRYDRFDRARQVI
jgi:Glycosyltransferase family 87